MLKFVVENWTNIRYSNYLHGLSPI